MYVFIGAEIKTGLCSGKGTGELYLFCNPSYFVRDTCYRFTIDIKSLKCTLQKKYNSYELKGDFNCSGLKDNTV